MWVTARDPGCSLSLRHAVLDHWDNHSDTSPPGDCFHYSQNIRARGRLWWISFCLINKQTITETMKREAGLSFETQSQENEMKEINSFICSLGSEYCVFSGTFSLLTLNVELGCFSQFNRRDQRSTTKESSF